jgi:hypothetical protein
LQKKCYIIAKPLENYWHFSLNPKIMKQKTVKFVGGSNSYTHTANRYWLRVVRCCVIMAVLMFGTFGMSKAQSITIDAPSTVYSNTLVSISLNTSCAVSSVNWDLQGGTIVNSYSNGATIEVRFANTGYKYIQATAIISCNPTYQQQLLNTSANINVVQAPNPPVVISGRVANPCGVGIQGVAIQGFPTSVATDYDGYYSVTVPYAWTGVVSASLSPFSFSPSQSVVNTTANRTLNFTVNAGSLTGASLSVTKGFSPLLGTTFTIGGMIPGYSYIYSYTYNDGSSSTGNITPATNSIAVYQVTNGLRFCIQVACGGSMPVCSN